MKSRYVDAAYKSGFYHQLGKALVPEAYQVWQKDFSEEEKEIYRRYTVDGRLLVASLQERGSQKTKVSSALMEIPTKNIAWLMMRQACEQHMERYDGSGYPKGLKGKQISPIAQIVGLAKELDRLSAETISEHPFEEAWELLLSQSGKDWAPELISVLRKNEDACRNVYQKYIQYTKTIPETIPLLRKREGRPLGLRYQPLVGANGVDVVGYEAVPWFGGILGDDNATEDGDAVTPMLQRAELLSDVMFYLLYEAADLAQRMRNCGIGERAIVTRCLSAFFDLEDQTDQMDQLIDYQELRKERMLLLVDEAYVLSAGQNVAENLQDYAAQGYTLVLDNCHPGELSIEQLKGLGFRWLRISPELYKKSGSAGAMRELLEAGFRLMARDVADEDTLSWLQLVGVELIGGPLTGELMTEDELIRDELAKLR